MNIRSAATEAGDSSLLEKGARLGYSANALLHVLIAWVILQLAWDVPGSGGEADEQGALRTLAGSGVGSVLLWLTVVGFALLALWQVTEAFARRDTGDRLKAAGKAVVYLALGWTAFTVVQGTGSGSGSESVTALCWEARGAGSSSARSDWVWSAWASTTWSRDGPAASCQTSSRTPGGGRSLPGGSGTSPRASP